MKTNVFRDGKIHVMAKVCETCIFKPGNRMMLRPGRVDQMVRDATSDDGCIPCHHTTYGQGARGEAVCRGFFEKHPTSPLQVADRLGMIAWQQEQA